MSFEEKSTWVSMVVSVLVLSAYSMFVLGQLQSVPAAQIAYQRPMLIAVGAIIVMTIVGTILMSIGTAVSAEISAKISGGGSVAEIDRKDERDDDINRRGELVGYYVSSAGALGVLALAMLRYDQFWIANALYLTFMVGGLASATAKLIVYRRGF
ncbi:MAG: hypothetical protein A2Y38_21635 [Spirochaetes bacterium GWB1_59_5]|nr:MAG: hypothetical protein A2Y38_21635 [Spirochaetes bacterium GWB1_59_5]